MSVTARIDFGKFEKQANECLQKIDKSIVVAIQKLADECLQYMRDTSLQHGTPYKDITGNLRASTGYVILYNGDVIKKCFPGRKGITAKVSSSVNPASIAEKTAMQAANYHTKGYSLILVAGMKYAEVVQRVKNEDVTTSADIFLKSNAMSIIQEIIDKELK